MADKVFLFECSSCGRYHVTQERLERFLNPTQLATFREHLANGVAGLIINFGKQCPQCCPTGSKDSYKIGTIDLK